MSTSALRRRTAAAIEIAAGWIAVVSTSMAWLAGLSILSLSAFMVVDIVNRHRGSFYSGATDELAGYILAFAASWAMAYTLLTGKHVAIDVLAPRIPSKVRHVLTVVGFLSVFTLAALLAWYSLLLSLDSFEFDARSVSVLQIPQGVPQMLMAAGFAWLAVQAASLAVLHVVSPGSATDATLTGVPETHAI